MPLRDSQTKPSVARLPLTPHQTAMECRGESMSRERRTALMAQLLREAEELEQAAASNSHTGPSPT